MIAEMSWIRREHSILLTRISVDGVHIAERCLASALGTVIRGRRSRCRRAGLHFCRHSQLGGTGRRSWRPGAGSTRSAAHHRIAGHPAGANVRVVQRLLGHATAAMTLDHYAHLLNDDLTAVADALSKAIERTAVSVRYSEQAGSAREDRNVA
jgi:integrase